MLEKKKISSKRFHRNIAIQIHACKIESSENKPYKIKYHTLRAPKVLKRIIPGINPIEKIHPPTQKTYKKGKKPPTPSHIKARIERRLLCDTNSKKIVITARENISTPNKTERT